MEISNLQTPLEAKLDPYPLTTKLRRLADAGHRFAGQVIDIHDDTYISAIFLNADGECVGTRCPAGIHYVNGQEIPDGQTLDPKQFGHEYTDRDARRLNQMRWWLEYIYRDHLHRVVSRGVGQAPVSPEAGSPPMEVLRMVDWAKRDAETEMRARGEA